MAVLIFSAIGFASFQRSNPYFSTVILPPALQPGDTIAITATARKMSIESLKYAQEAIAHFGYQEHISETVGAAHHIFAGNDDLRANEFQTYLDDPMVKAIWCGRGGYGTIRMLDKLNWEGFLKHPKWIIGFSDVTNVLTHCTSLGQAAIHGPMPIGLSNSWRNNVSVQRLFETLAGNVSHYKWPGGAYCERKSAQGRLIGGNLANFTMMAIGLPKSYFDGAILFIEDIDEYLYQIDRMLRSLKYSGKLNGIKGIVVGQFSQMKDNEDPFGANLEEIVKEVFNHLNIPIAFGFEAGHEKDNWPIVLGASYELGFDREWELKPCF